jgi:hypothetical protein
MAMTEADRLFMHEGLRACMTQKVADLLMEHLPPTGWADVARIQDLDNLKMVLDTKFDSIHTQFVAVKYEFTNLERVMNTQLVAINSRLNRMDTRLGVIATTYLACFIGIIGAIITKL